jgi:hypothetical protein
MFYLSKMLNAFSYVKINCAIHHYSNLLCTKFESIFIIFLCLFIFVRFILSSPFSKQNTLQI